MMRNPILIVTGSLLLAAGSMSAQAPAPPAAPVAPLAPLPPAPGRQPAPPAPFNFDFDFSLDPTFQQQMAQVSADVARATAQIAQVNVSPYFQGRFGKGASDDQLYTNGQRSLDRNQWDEALGDFTRVAANGGSRADGALYWKAYTLNKLGRRDEASAALAELRKSYASSRWLNDAGALEMEIKQAGGQNVSPESQPDEELKLMALNALVHSDPDRAMPLLENLLKSAQPPRLKERALFVLSQSDAPRAHQLLEQVARGGGNPDLQVTALNYLGAQGRKQDNSQILLEIYASTTDSNVKRAVLRTWAAFPGADTGRFLQAVRAEKSVELRAEGVRMLGNRPDAGDTLVAMYGSEPDAQVKRAIADSLYSQRNAKALVDLARKETDPQMKRDIVRRLSSMQSKEATDYLMELLK